MSEIIKRTFKCTGCGESRPCFLTTNQSKSEIAFNDPAEYLKCVLDETNNTSTNWQEVQANEVNKSTDPVLHIQSVSHSRLQNLKTYWVKYDDEWQPTKAHYPFNDQTLYFKFLNGMIVGCDQIPEEHIKPLCYCG